LIDRDEPMGDAKKGEVNSYPMRNQPGSNAGMGTLPKSGFDFDKSPGLFFDQLECNGLGRA
jgi:hypothetical protein